MFGCPAVMILAATYISLPHYIVTTPTYQVIAASGKEVVLGFDRIKEGDRITVLGVEAGEMEPGKQVRMKVTTREGRIWEARLNHSFHAGQIKWLRAGSALNFIKRTKE
jgi:acetyl-CoA acetyltransferase